MKDITIENLKVHTFTPNDVLVLSIPYEYTRPEPMEAIRETLDKLEIDLEKQYASVDRWRRTLLDPSSTY